MILSLSPRFLPRALATVTMVTLLAACAGDPAKGSGPARPVGGHGHAAFMGSYDVNRDGVVTRDEYDTVRKQRYMAADANGDGWLSEAEYVAEFEKRLKAQYAKEGKAADERYHNSMKQAYVRFGIVDKDKDGKFTIDEEISIANKTFKNADTNSDGAVDARDKKE